MARASVRLIRALRDTAARLEQPDTVYRWSQLAHCNCGHLTQTITGLPPQSIRLAAGQHRGDWAEQARELGRGLGAPDYGSRPPLDEGAWEPEDLGFCAIAERSMSDIFSELLEWGLAPSDVGALERLDDPAVRRRLGAHTSELLHSDRNNVIAYLRAWAALLEEELRADVRPASPAGRDAGPADELELPVAAE